MLLDILKKSIDYAYFSFVLISFFTFQTHSFRLYALIVVKCIQAYGRLTDDDDDSLKIRLSFTAHINIYIKFNAFCCPLTNCINKQKKENLFRIWKSSSRNLVHEICLRLQCALSLSCVCFFCISHLRSCTYQRPNR